MNSSATQKTCASCLHDVPLYRVFDYEDGHAVRHSGIVLHVDCMVCDLNKIISEHLEKIKNQAKKIEELKELLREVRDPELC